MENKIKIIGILFLAGFSFFYTNKVTSIIKDNDPIMKRITESKKEVFVSKIDPIIINDEYYTGINGCIVDEEESYNKMKNVGIFKEELIVMKEDKVKQIGNKYIVGGNKKKRNVSIILLNTNDKINKYTSNNRIIVNYFLDGEFIKNNIDKLIELKYSNVYNYGRSNNYSSKYLVYDNTVIETNFNNESNYCLLENKNEDVLKLCSSYKMKSIKEKYIKEDSLLYTKENLHNGKIFIYDNNNNNEIILSIKYILSKGYNIVSLDDLLTDNNSCK